MPEENAGAPESQICGNLRGVVGQFVGVRGVRVATAVRCPVDRTVRPEAVNDGRRDAGEVCRWIGGKSRGEVPPDRDGASIGGFGLVCCKDDVAVVDGRNPANSALAPLRWLRCAGFAPAAMPPVVFVVFVLSVLYVVFVLSTLASLYSSYALSFDPLGVVI